MSAQMKESIFFGDLPDLNNLCAVKIILNAGIPHPDIRDKQLKLCRCLLLFCDQIVASPIPEEFTQILVIMSISFYKSGKVQSVAEKQQFKMERPERVTAAMLQTCLFYTITMRLAPSWNKAGHLLIQGADFLTKSGKQDAVEVSINISDNQLFITVQVHTVCLPPAQLHDFDLASECLGIPLMWNSLFIRKKNNWNSWCYVLPSMKMGRIVGFSHDIPPECPFKSYKDFQDYWKTLYGYELPHISGDVMYCSIYFKFIGEKFFTYPLICLRSQPIQFYPQADVTTVLNTFVDDLRSKIPNLCGFPVNMTNTPVYPVKGFTRPLSQGNEKHLTNLTTRMTLAMNPPNSPQPVCSTEVTQKKIPLDHSLEHSEKLEHSPTLCTEQMTSFKEPLGSQHSDSSRPICSTHSENILKYVPSFGRDAKKNTASNVLHKPIKIKSSKEATSNTAVLPCPSPLSERQFCISANHASRNNTSNPNPKNSEPSQYQICEYNKLNCANDTALISHKRREDDNVAGSDKASKKHIAANQLYEYSLQEELLVLTPKRCKTIKSVNRVDVEQHARDNKLFKLTNADLQEWLKHQGVSTRTREKKEQLVAKVMQFIQKY
ncbi:uncharacterized protein C18orf63 homolog isoform X2 [Dendropsophus ebraccatus]|uniref:uncharacterized protein C18orf63 homolog isoform X2 n=1 Tax=Dendropsophus ebraccatus TaxID=150705 RepID=UPI00383220AC